MKRQKISLADIADYNNLCLALHKASKGKQHRRDVLDFHQGVDKKLSAMALDILAEKMPYGRFKAFQIYDPKKRLIYAACFEDRIFHHAVMNIAGENLERIMFFHSYACRPNKGVHKAVQQVQNNIKRFPWLVKIDIAAYFSSIDHDILLGLLLRHFKGVRFCHQLYRIIKSCPDMQYTGLPIGSLTSQYFANFYLDGLDRLLASHHGVAANIRYMDDIIWWCHSKHEAKEILAYVIEYLKTKRLTVKANVQILPSRTGVTYCGFRIMQGVVRLSRRRKRTLIKRRQHWEDAYKQGDINDCQLQTAYAAVHAIAQGTDSLAWRQKQLLVKPPLDV
ncbi:Reverse transcriptase domain-containing protein [Candidatus Electrothrix laxa]